MPFDREASRRAVVVVHALPLPSSPPGAFHHNKWNQLIHILFVPLIVWSAMVFFILATPGDAHSFATLTEKDALSAVLPVNGLNLALPVFLLYAIYYVTLDFWPGLVYDAFLYVLLLAANHLVAESPNALAIALGVHVLSWYMQIHPGHLILEKRRPALTQSFFQSLVLAPIFTFFELLFAMGFRKKLYDRVTVRHTGTDMRRKALCSTRTRFECDWPAC